MKLPRNVGLTDLAVVTVVLVLIVLPGREMYATPIYKGDDAQQFAIALAEARTMASPQDGNHVAELARQVGDAGWKDWGIEIALDGTRRTSGSPTEWKALLAASVAYVDKLEVAAALDYANRALTSCRALPTGCPSWEEVRMSLYQQHLDAGVKSGIDPRRDPKGFRAAGEGALRSIHLNSRERDQSEVPSAPAPAPK
jgi:hypothetical protein